ncbi:putative phage abortive infection protein [Sporosarcina beigongshangi]|uniref:putative phage abortive infection protein n=1 Tax=Sporosarcina beigongshangi TaxID=2782538 RepID=UPI001939D6D1|nr:putative phage abortive infection protein [Sporosarcina beigongshangi]
MDNLKWYQKKENLWIMTGSLIALFALATPLIIMRLTNSGFNLSDFRSISPIADYLGGTTVGFLSLASMFFVIAAIVMQKEELRLQREELQLTRTELEKTREEHAMTNKTMKLQQFETTLFNMMNLYTEILNELYYAESSGRVALEEVYEKINNDYLRHTIVDFTFEFMNNDSLPLDIRLREYSEVVYNIRINNKPIWRFLKIPHSRDEEPTIDFVCESISGFSEEEREHGYRYILYKEYKSLTQVIPENILVKKFVTSYIGEDYYTKKSFNTVVSGNKHMLNNYLKVVKMILNLIDGNEDALFNSLSEEEKKKYFKIFFSQLSAHEIMILHYYMKLGTDHVLKYFQDEYSIIKSDDILNDSII